MKKSKRFGALLAATVAAVFVLAGCSSPSGGSNDAVPAPTKKEDIRIGVSFYNKTNPLYSVIEEGMRAKAEELGVELDITFADNTAATQMNQIGTFITKGVDFILASPFDVDALVPVYQEARAAGIPIFSFGNSLAEEEQDGRVGPDLLKLAKDTMEATIEQMGGSGKILFVAGPPQIGFVQAQKKGFAEVVAGNPGVEIVETLTVADMTSAAAVDVGTSGLTNFRDVNAVISSNDDISLGVIQAAETLGLDVKKIVFASWNGSPAAIESIREGRQTLTLSQAPFGWGEIAIQTAVDWLNGKKPASHLVETPFFIVSPENVDTLTKEELR